MTLKQYKYIVTVEGLEEPLEYSTYEDAVSDLKVFMPCKATIEAKQQ